MKARVVSYSFPSSCMADTEVDFSIVGHIEEADNPCIGFFYSDGPADYVMVDSGWRTKIPKGVSARVVYQTPPWTVCTEMAMRSPTFRLIFPVSGTYRLDVFAGYSVGGTPVVEDGPYSVFVDVAPFVPAKVSITSYNVPSKAYAGSSVSFNVKGHVDVGGGNPCVGLMYVDGPSPSIRVTGRDVAKGQACVFGYAYQDACSDLSLGDSLVFPSAGSYRLAAIGGWVDVLAGTINETDRIEVTVDVAEATANISGKVVESLLFGVIKRPSRGARVSLDSLKFTYAGDDGSYSLADVPLGTYRVSASKPFFEGRTLEISLTEVGETYSLNFEIPISKWVNYGIIAGAAAVPLLALAALRR